MLCKTVSYSLMTAAKLLTASSVFDRPPGTLKTVGSAGNAVLDDERVPTSNRSRRIRCERSK